jgi:hypothetical protein
MSNETSTATSIAAAPDRPQMAAHKQQQVLRKREVLAAIRGRWGKFSEQELSELESTEDLVARRAAKYGLAHAVARRDVALLLDGRGL